MNKPSEYYCYVPERKEKYNYKILKSFRNKCIDHLVENPDGIRLPHKLGDIKIIGFKPIIAYLDKKLTKLHGKEIFHDNSHTDGYVFRFIWYPKYVQGLKRKTGGFRNSRFFRFKASAPLRQRLVEWIKQGNWTHFGTVENREDIKP